LISFFPPARARSLRIGRGWNSSALLRRVIYRSPCGTCLRVADPCGRRTLRVVRGGSTDADLPGMFEYDGGTFRDGISRVGKFVPKGAAEAVSLGCRYRAGRTGMAGRGYSNAIQRASDVAA
jgi:hypothetical protein